LHSGIVGIGCDLVRISRVERLLTRYGDKFMRRAFHESEIAVMRAATSPGAAAQFAASRWAVKEAVYKAMGGQWRLRFPDVYVRHHDASRRPVLAFDGDTATRFHALCGGTAAQHHVSISHEDQYAMAHVILTTACESSKAMK
jgi:holo-[acyl-carrier protein] synthase